MDWVKLISDRARTSGLLRVDELARELHVSEIVVGNALRRQEVRGLVEHLGKKIYINRLVHDFAGRELINMLRPEGYLSLETVLRDAGVSTQSPTALTCVTPGRPGEFRSKSLTIIFRHVSRKFYWGYHEKQTRYGKYNIAEPEKALADWVYLNRQEGSTVELDELDLHWLDLGKLLQYSARFPIPVQRQILEAVANYNIVQVETNR